MFGFVLVLFSLLVLIPQTFLVMLFIQFILIGVFLFLYFLFFALLFTLYPDRDHGQSKIVGVMFMREAYCSPCDPCEYNDYAVDEEFGDCLYDECSCPDPDNLCWIVQWQKEIEKKQLAQKDRDQSDGSHVDQ